MFSIKKKISKAANKVSEFVDEHQTGILLACETVEIGAHEITTT